MDVYKRLGFLVLGLCSIAQVSGMTVLHQAAKNGDTDSLFDALLRARHGIKDDQPWEPMYDIHALDEKQRTALHYAVYAGSLPCVRMLLARKARVEIPDFKGWTPLHFAAYGGFASIARVLMSNKAEVDSKNTYHYTPLHIAASHEHVDVMALLLQNQADVNARSIEKVTPLHVATEKGCVKAMHLLLTAGAERDCINRNGLSPLHCAIKLGQLEAVRELCRAGVNPNLKVLSTSVAPLHIAVHINSPDIVWELILAGADCHACNCQGLTPMQMAYRNNYFEVALMLIAGTDLDKDNVDSRSEILAKRYACVKVLRASVDIHMKVLDLLARRWLYCILQMQAALI